MTEISQSSPAILALGPAVTVSLAASELPLATAPFNLALIDSAGNQARLSQLPAFQMAPLVAPLLPNVRLDLSLGTQSLTDSTVLGVGIGDELVIGSPGRDGHLGDFGSGTAQALSAESHLKSALDAVLARLADQEEASRLGDLYELDRLASPYASTGPSANLAAAYSEGAAWLDYLSSLGEDELLLSEMDG